MSELDSAIKQLQKNFGKNFIDYGGKSIYNDYDRTSFGIASFDFNTGGGLPKGKVVTIAGKYSSGKTTTALCAIAEVQKAGGKVAYIDTENSFDYNWAKSFGVKPEELIMCHPDTIEEVTDVMETLLITGELDLIVFDSVAATCSKKGLEESGDQKSMGGIAKEVGLLMRKITARIKHVKTAVLIINQLRDAIGGWGSAEYMPGGNQIKNQTDIMIYMRVSNWIGDKAKPDGVEIKFRVSKNKTAPPLKTGIFELYFDGHINNDKTLLEEAIKVGIVGKAGGWFYYKDENNKTQGLDKFAKTLSTKDLEKIKEKTLKSLKDK